MPLSNLQFSLPDVPKRVLQFVGSWEGEGTSTICQEFAKVSAATFGDSVLLLDADPHPPNVPSSFEIDSDLSEFPSKGLSSSQAFWHVKGMRLCLGSLRRCLPSPMPLAHSQRMGAFWKTLKEGFNLVLIDSAPAIKSPESLSLSRWKGPCNYHFLREHTAKLERSFDCLDSAKLVRDVREAIQVLKGSVPPGGWN